MARREFLKSVGAGALGAAGLNAGGPLAQAKPVETSADLAKKPRLLAGCCAYSYRELLTHGQMTMEDFILKAVELGLDAVDMTVYFLKGTDAGYLEGLRRLAYKNAVGFSGAACGASLVQADAAKRADALMQVKKWVDVTERLGASHLRIFAGELPAGAALKEAADWTVEGMKAACDYAGAKGIMLGIEDHMGVTQSADVCVEIMQRVNSPYAGINLDITNFISTPEKDDYAQIAACLPYATVSHIRDHFPDGRAVDMDRVWRLYAEAGHKGVMSVEYEGGHKDVEPVAGAARLIASTRELCRKYSSV